MASIVVPFRGPGSKQRLGPTPDGVRSALAHAMLGDVLAACVAVGQTLLVTADEAAQSLAAELGAALLADPGRGQGAAVAAGLIEAAESPALVVNADLPCARPRDLLALLGSLPARGLALVPASDGTTNALGLAALHLFAPLYGPDSSRRFRERAARLGAETVETSIPNRAEDVDTVADLERLATRAGPRTRAALDSLCLGLTR
jgi:2-phospho-L-lactate guanylyltransferase